MKTTDTSHISPTAHLTSYVWLRNGLSHEALVTPYGRRLYRTLQPFDALYRRLSGKAGLERVLMARHQLIDKLLAEAIEEGRIGQVLEVAAGLSPRGFRFARRYPHVVYIEGDLPHMVATKLQLLNRAGSRSAHHHVVELNALVDEGAKSIGGVIRSLLDPNKGAVQFLCLRRSERGTGAGEGRAGITRAQGRGSASGDLPEVLAEHESL